MEEGARTAVVVYFLVQRQSSEAGIARPLGKILLTISKSERRRFASILLAKFEAF